MEVHGRGRLVGAESDQRMYLLIGIHSARLLKSILMDAYDCVLYSV